MPARRKPAQPETIDVGGVHVTSAEIKDAMMVLTDSLGIMVRQPLVRQENPLKDSDYHGLAAEQRKIDAEPRMGTKSAYLRALERLLAEHAGA